MCSTSAFVLYDTKDSSNQFIMTIDHHSFPPDAHPGQLGPIAKSLSPVLYNSTLQELARSMMMTMITMNGDDDGGGVAICFARSTPDLLALMKAFALSINSPVLQKVPSIHI